MKMDIQLREFAAWARNRKVLVTLFMTITLAVGMLVGTLISGRVGASHPSAGSGAAQLIVPDPVQLSSAFVGIVKRVQPSVVNIATTQVATRRGQGGQGRRGREQGPDEEQPFQDFFNRFFDFPDQGPTPERSLGSGVIV